MSNMCRILSKVGGEVQRHPPQSDRDMIQNVLSKLNLSQLGNYFVDSGKKMEATAEGRDERVKTRTARPGFRLQLGPVWQQELEQFTLSETQFLLSNENIKNIC